MKKIYFLLLALGLFTCAKAQIINIPDANFKAKLLAASPNNEIAKNSSGNWFKIDANSNGEIEVNEALNVIELNVSNPGTNSYSTIRISNITGLTYFSNLLNFSCSYNSLTSLDVRSLVNLQTLNCGNNRLTSLDVSGLVNLETLYCYASIITEDNPITSLNISGLINLQTLDCRGCLMPSLDVSSLANLKALSCGSDQLISLNVSGLINLKSLFCTGHQLVPFDVSSLTNLESLNCSWNDWTSIDVSNLKNLKSLTCMVNKKLTSIDVSNLTNLKSLNCDSDDQLTTLFIKNGSDETSLNFPSTPNLRFICVDDSQITQVQNKVNAYGYTNCSVNSYCTFTPGGTFYTIHGNNKWDINNNGCDVNDVVFPNLKYNITDIDGSNTGGLISNISGNYSIAVGSGTHTITPILENPTYFNISPTSVNVTFPAQTSPVIQNFCVTPNGVHPDLEVTILPLNPARPGFDAKYKIIYKNKGNIAQSGAVNLAFNDAVLDMVVANPVVSNQSVNNLSWSFTNLLPYETREIALTLNVNSPMETPAVNGGDVLNHTATITPVNADNTPNDNTFTLKQTVVNSFDPNDKTCLEGSAIAPSQIGNYVHYMIRFENTGTYPAENIVVKDMIDLSKFDINSLVPLKGSHSFVTNINSDNKVEFIFENINLPFDDAHNDGFVAFKIKTRPTLVVGNTFSNSASIYFDYNRPIVTNTATTNIVALSNQDFSFATYFMLYPNPVNDVLTIETKQTIEVSSINIYNQLGQLVLVVPNAQNVSKVDVSGLASGNYFIKINSDKGTSNTKFIKQ